MMGIKYTPKALFFIVLHEGLALKCLYLINYFIDHPSLKKRMVIKGHVFDKIFFKCSQNTDMYHRDGQK